MSVWLVIPVRSLHDGKTRLASALDGRRRFSLVEWLLGRTLQQASSFPGLDRTMVVTRCDRTASYAAGKGAVALRESSAAGLNGAVQQAFDVVAASGARRMLVIAADLPLVSVDDLSSLVAAASTTAISVAPDRHETGTNGLCLSTDRPFAFSFGVDSLARHLGQIRRIQMNSAVVRRPGLAFDLDVHADLQQLLEGASLSPSDQAFLRTLGSPAGSCSHFKA